MPDPLNLPYDEKYVQFDYDVRTDQNPVYAGFSNSNVSDDDTRWTIRKYTYDVSSRCTKIQTVYKKAWSARTTASFWA